MKETQGEVFSINHAPTVLGEIQRMPSHVTSLTPESSLWNKKIEKVPKKNTLIPILPSESCFNLDLQSSKCINCVNLDN